MSKFAAYLNAALALAWLALFFTNDALFVSHEVDLSDHLRGDAFAMAWAGSAICSRLYIALVNYGVEGEVVMVGAASPTNMRDTKTYNVYRDDYTPHGHAVCASLQRLGGPPCPTRADGVRIACDRVREAFLLAGHRPASLLPPNSKKRCVPMTGKQQCERVPGGCGRA